MYTSLYTYEWCMWCRQSTLRTDYITLCVLTTSHSAYWHLYTHTTASTQSALSTSHTPPMSLYTSISHVSIYINASCLYIRQGGMYLYTSLSHVLYITSHVFMYSESRRCKHMTPSTPSVLYTSHTPVMPLWTPMSHVFYIISHTRVVSVYINAPLHLKTIHMSFISKISIVHTWDMTHSYASCSVYINKSLHPQGIRVSVHKESRLYIQRITTFYTYRVA